jgi:hypothetical protein
MPRWSKINNNTKNYRRKVNHISGNNKFFERTFECRIQKNDLEKVITIWDLEFSVTKFKESCNYHGFEITNIYYVDNVGIVRRSLQYHSDSIGYITTERLDR